MKPVLIWWTDQKACEAIEDWGGPLIEPLPQYIKDQFSTRLGRNGRCRLWVAKQLGDIAIDPWPDTPCGRWLVSMSAAGIAIDYADMKWVIGLPGIVTNLDLNKIIPVYV